MLSKTFSAMIIFSFVSACLTNNVERMAESFVSSLSDAVTLCLSLLGMMCFWSGIMKVIAESGVLNKLTAVITPLIKPVFGKETAKGENLENLSAAIMANFLGLGNAALPLGINAVKGFEKENKSGIATDSTIMFAVLNTVPFQLIPSTLIALRSKYGSQNPYDVVPYIWLCSLLIIIFTVVVCKVMSRLWRNR